MGLGWMPKELMKRRRWSMGRSARAESSGAAYLVHGEYARDTEAVTMESKMGLPQETVKVEAESGAAVVPARESKVEPRQILKANQSFLQLF